MFFEGPEKKLEIVVSKDTPSLREQTELWPVIVDAARAKILSKISTSTFDAYLLSESSLFVHEDRFTMITCGTTTLISAVTEFLTHFSVDNVDSLIYERKNELFPRSQVTSFEDDAKTLNRYLPGNAYRFGAEDGHHIFLFHLTKPFTPPKDDKTLEFLMHGISQETCKFFSAPNTINEIRKVTAFSEFFPEFEIDDHIFEPQGYSLNACKDQYYFTIHVTPQKIGSYVSFETNYYTSQDIAPLLNALLEVFAPSSCDLLLFQTDSYKGLNNDKFKLKKEVKQTLECGYDVLFHHYYNTENSTIEAFKLKI